MSFLEVTVKHRHIARYARRVTRHAARAKIFVARTRRTPRCARVRDEIMFSLTVEQLIVNLDVVAQILAS